MLFEIGVVSFEVSKVLGMSNVVLLWGVQLSVINSSTWIESSPSSEARPDGDN